MNCQGDTVKFQNKGFKNILLSLILPFLFLLTWIFFSHKINLEVVLPKVSTVLLNFRNLNSNFIGLGSIPQNLLVSLIRVLLGYFLGAIIALPLGIFMGYSDNIFYLFNTFINMFKPVPTMAWGPLILAWFGFSSLATILNIPYGPMQVYFDNFKVSMMFIIAIGSFFPIIINTIHGVRNVDKTLIESAQVLGANSKDIFLKILLPSAAPTILTGLRIGLAGAWSCLIAAELLPGSLAGIGFLINYARELARTDIVITGIICIGLTGALLDYIFVYFERRFFSWKES